MNENPTHNIGYLFKYACDTPLCTEVYDNQIRDEILYEHPALHAHEHTRSLITARVSLGKCVAQLSLYVLSFVYRVIVVLVTYLW